MAIQMGQTQLRLASASPRRRQLLEQLGFSLEILPAHVDETPARGEAPETYVDRVAREKAEAVAQRDPQRLVLAADTVVVAGEEILGKPGDSAQARRMLGLLSGQTHRVLTSVALAGRWRGQARVETRVRFRRITAAEVAWYIGTGEPMDKAGGYALQGQGAAFIDAIDGSPSNVIGLPLCETLDLLQRAGWPMPWAAP